MSRPRRDDDEDGCKIDRDANHAGDVFAAIGNHPEALG
jgi:hypothetical protein